MKKQDHKALSAVDKGYAKLNNKWKCLFCSKEYKFRIQVQRCVQSHSTGGAGAGGKGLV